MEGITPLIKLKILGLTVPLENAVLAQWAVMLLIAVPVLLLGKAYKTIPSGIQSAAEMIVETIQGLVRDNMGEEYEDFTPFMGTIIIYLLLLNLTGLAGVKPPTTNYSVAAAFALISFILIHALAVGKNGFLKYLKGYAEPYSFMLPLNIIERFIVPVSLSLRLYGNMTASAIMLELLYKGLSYGSKQIGLGIPVLQTVIPIPFHIYFDIFDGIVQMFIFVMLTMVFTKITSQH